MTVSTTSTKITADGNDATTVWPFTFAVQDENEIVVTLTEADGTVTVLPSNSYTVIINSATGTNPTPVGGSVTYPLSGSPVATGDLLTIQRLAEYVQETSLANQGITWQTTIELALDYQCMLIQQLNFQIGQQFSVPVSDDPPAELPVASLRANMLAGFDASGNMTAVELADGEVAISAAMIPVVTASTLALARTALGLGDLATEAIGAGLEDDGAGALRVINALATDAGATAVTASFHLKQRYATAAITYTLPANSTLFNGFGFWVAATAGAVTFAIDAGDSFDGMPSGTSLIIPNGTQVWVTTDAAGVWYVRENQLIGYDSPLNLSLSASVATNALTISVKDRNGNDPSAASPVIAAFRDPTAANGNPVVRALTSSLSIVVPSGAELGTADAVPFRVWVGLFDNAGTLVLGVFQTVVGGTAPTQIYPIDEASLNTGTAIGTGSDSAGVWYTGSGVATKATRILGYVDFNAGQASKGVWATSPSKVQLFGPGIKLPGDVVQRKRLNTSTLGSTTSAGYAALSGGTPPTLAITPLSPCNKPLITYSGSISNSGGAATMGLALGRGAVQLNTDQVNTTSGAGAGLNFMQKYLDYYLDANSVTYQFYGKTASGTLQWPGANSFLNMDIEEIMS